MQRVGPKSYCASLSMKFASSRGSSKLRFAVIRRTCPDKKIGHALFMEKRSTNQSFLYWRGKRRTPHPLSIIFTYIHVYFRNLSEQATPPDRKSRRGAAYRRSSPPKLYVPASTRAAVSEARALSDKFNHKTISRKSLNAPHASKENTEEQEKHEKNR